MKLGIFGSSLIALSGSLIAATAIAQTAGGSATAQTGLNLPANPVVFTADNASVRKATAIVNGYVITGTDVDHRLVLTLLSSGGQPTVEERQMLRQQVLRNLVDETLQIQAAEREEIKVEPREIDAYFARYADGFKQTPEAFTAYLKSAGSSATSIKRQIHGEMAWTRLQGRRISPFVNIAEDEVQSVLDRLNAAKGQREYRIGEIFISATPETEAEARANADRIVQQLQNGGSFQSYARQFSEASTAGVGGDLGWVRAEQLPEPLAEAARAMPVGAVSSPIALPGGFSILAVQDTRQVLVADQRDAVLSLKQMTIAFPKGMTQAQAAPLIQDLLRTAQTMGGCGNAEQAAAKIGAEVVSSDQVAARDLPPALQEMLLKLNIGQATNPFGSLDEGVRVLVLCGRDDPVAGTGPTFDQVYAQLEEQRVNMRSRRYLRDLRRDAVVDYR